MTKNKNLITILKQSPKMKKHMRETKKANLELLDILTNLVKKKDLRVMQALISFDFLDPKNDQFYESPQETLKRVKKRLKNV